MKFKLLRWFIVFVIVVSAVALCFLIAPELWVSAYDYFSDPHNVKKLVPAITLIGFFYMGSRIQAKKEAQKSKEAADQTENERHD